MKNYLLIAMFTAVVFLGSAQTASACSCVRPLPGVSLKTQVTTSKKEATVIFAGKVLSIRYSAEKMNGTPLKAYAKIAVERSWKGPLNELIEVETENICCICGYTFEIGKTYIIYSYSPNPGTINVSSCSRTAQITDTSPDEKYLGKVRKPKKS
ncbi:MAG: hypothetical protein IPI64_08980 [Chloracidobacterium sp.]|nr:hypothetical protein [Chloracidobacterium sp.]